MADKTKKVDLKAQLRERLKTILKAYAPMDAPETGTLELAEYRINAEALHQLARTFQGREEWTSLFPLFFRVDGTNYIAELDDDGHQVSILTGIEDLGEL